MAEKADPDKFLEKSITDWFRFNIKNGREIVRLRDPHVTYWWSTGREVPPPHVTNPERIEKR